MAVFNYLRKEIDAKIVYYGPGLCGKTTNLQFIHQHLKPDQRGKMVSLATDEDRTLFFDFLPIELENVRGFRTRFHLYTVPGQVYYGATRRAVLTGADGVIFVVDSQIEKMEENLYSLRDLEENLRYYGKKMETTPFIIQYNKRDLPNILPMEELNEKINHLNAPYFEAVAISGKGVFESLTMVCRMVLKAIEAGVEARAPSGMAAPAPEATVAEAPPVEKRIPRPGQPRVSQDITPPTPVLRLEKEAARPEPPRAGQDVTRARMLRPEKEVPQAETPRPAKIPSVASPKLEAETSGPVSRTILSRILDKKKVEPLPKPDEEQEKKISAAKEKMRILSCGQPRISSPSSLEIPLTLEIDGLGKNLSFILTIKLEQPDQKVN